MKKGSRKSFLVVFCDCVCTKYKKGFPGWVDGGLRLSFKFIENKKNFKLNKIK